MESYGVTGDVLDIRGQQSVSFVINGCEFNHTFLICTLPTEAAVLVGTDFMASLGAVTDFEGSKMVLPTQHKVPQVYSVPPTGHKALTVFSRGGPSPKFREREAKRMDEQFPANPSPENKTEESMSWLVRATENVRIAPRCRKIVLGRLETGKEQNLPPLICLEPAQIPIEGIHSARGLARVQPKATTPSLSRHVGTVLDDGILSKEIILLEQRKDSFCKSQKPGKYSSRSKFLLDEDGVMYRCQPKTRYQLVVPRILVEDIIKMNNYPV
jgi:hypothetical protein